MSHGVYAAHRIELSMKTFPMNKLQKFGVIDEVCSMKTSMPWHPVTVPLPQSGVTAIRLSEVKV